MEPLPKELVTEGNEAVLRYLETKSAHSDLVEKFTEAAGVLDDVSFFCPDTSSYRYVVAYTGSVAFAFASGMRSAKFRLDPKSARQAIQHGGKAVEGLDGWTEFNVFDPELDLDLLAWCLEAHSYARQISDR